jgi:hypothetical protein
MKALLFVTWIVYGQPPSSYQSAFTSMAACEAARQAVFNELERLRAEQDAHTARVRQAFPGAAYNPVPYHQVTAVCVAQKLQGDPYERRAPSLGARQRKLKLRVVVQSANRGSTFALTTVAPGHGSRQRWSQ